MINVTCGIPSEETHQRLPVTQVGQWHMGSSCWNLGIKVASKSPEDLD